MMTLKTAFSTLSCPDWSFATIIEQGVCCGFDGVELRLLERQTDLLSHPQLQRTQRSDRRRELADAGFRICGLSSSVALHQEDPSEWSRQLETGRRYLELAAELGAGWIRVFGDVLQPVAGGGSVPIRDVSADRRESTIRRVAERLQILSESAEPLRLRVLIETHGDFADSTIMQAVMEQVRSPAAGVLWDTHHPWRFQGERLSETFARLRPWIRHSHWKDSVTSRLPQPAEAPSGTRADEESHVAAVQAHALMSGHQPADYVLFGAGEFPVAECLRLLVQSGYADWYCLEWEKMWHPELEPPEVALPQFVPALQRFLEEARRR